MLYILFSIAIVACIFVPRFYSFVYDVIFTKMRRHIRQIETSYFRVLRDLINIYNNSISPINKYGISFLFISENGTIIRKCFL